MTSWLSPAPVLVGALAVVFSGYLAAVFLAADSVRYGENSLAAAFRRRALVAGVLSGALALAGLLVMRGSGLDLTHGAALVLVCVSGVAGLATLALCLGARFGLARLTAAIAVAAVVVGWAAAQAPRFLPGMTVTQAATGRSTLVALVIAVACGSVVLVPALVCCSHCSCGAGWTRLSRTRPVGLPWLPWAPAAGPRPGPGPGRERGGKLARHRQGREARPGAGEGPPSWGWWRARGCWCSPTRPGRMCSAWRDSCCAPSRCSR